MRRCVTMLLAGAALLGVAPAALADVASVTATTDRGRSCTVRLEAYATGSAVTQLLWNWGSADCTADALYAQRMETLSVQLSSAVLSPAAKPDGPGSATCHFADYCGTSVRYSGTLPGVPYRVTGSYTLEAAGYPYDVPERWTGVPSGCRLPGRAGVMVCELSLTYTPPLAAPVL